MAHEPGLAGVARKQERREEGLPSQEALKLNSVSWVKLDEGGGGGTGSWNRGAFQAEGTKYLKAWRWEEHNVSKVRKKTKMFRRHVVRARVYLHPKIKLKKCHSQTSPKKQWECPERLQQAHWTHLIFFPIPVATSDCGGWGEQCKKVF